MTNQPPAPRRGPTVTLHMRLSADLDSALRAYAAEHDSNITNAVEAAISEYLDQRGRNPRNLQGGDQ